MGAITEYFELFLVIGADKQVIYFADRPIYHFPMIEERRGASRETILHSSKDAVWTPISIELPTRPLSFVTDWIEQKGKKNVMIRKVNKEDKTVEEWLLQSVEISSVINRRSRIADLDVLNVILRYSWARRTK